jgi:hypothetical protein
METIDEVFERLKNDIYLTFRYDECGELCRSEDMINLFLSDIDFIENHIKVLNEHIELLQEQNKFLVITKKVPF